MAKWKGTLFYDFVVSNPLSSRRACALRREDETPNGQETTANPTRKASRALAGGVPFFSFGCLPTKPSASLAPALLSPDNGKRTF